MDTHFVRPKDEGVRRSSDFGNLSKILKSFLPIFVLSAMLPFLIGFVVSPPDIGFLTRADSSSELRVWLEPANVVMSRGSEASFTVVASFESDTMLIPEISLNIVGGPSLSVNNPNLSYSIPFSGKVELGKVTVAALESGQATLTIPEDSIIITAFDSPLEITTGAANIVVR